jgi:uncharacterized membrane protein
MDITSDLTIDAPVEVVWGLTVDVEAWPATTPTMTSVERLDEGPLRVGSRARVVQPMQRPRVWTVTELVPEERFVWEAAMGPLTMRATHRLTAEGPRCRNLLRVDVSGVGSRLFRGLAGGRIRKAITTENEGFKAAAERGGPSADR